MALSSVSLRTVWVCGLLALLVGCASENPTPEDRVRATIDAVVEAVESGATRQVGELLHADYSDRRHPDKRSALASLFWYIRQHRDVHLFTLVRHLDVDADQSGAQAVIYVAMTAIPVESLETLISLKADLYRFDVSFVRLEGDEWQVASSRWERADIGAL